MERLFKVMIGMLAVAALLIGAAWFFLKHQISTGGPATTRLASAVPAESSPADPCHEAIVLTLQSHSGVSASMSAQTLDGQDVPTQDASGDEAGFTTACYQPDGAGDPEGSPQTIKICKPASFVLHISGNGKGVFDLQAKPRIRAGERPPNDTVPLPPLGRTKAVIDTADVLIEGTLYYAAANKVLEKRVTGKSIGSGWRRVKIESIVATEPNEVI